MSGSSPASSGCNMACAGNSAEMCGGPALLNVYNNTAYIYPGAVPQAGAYSLLSCYTDLTYARTLAAYRFTSPSMTAEMCVAGCQSNGYNYAGVEYAGKFSLEKHSIPTLLTIYSQMNAIVTIPFFPVQRQRLLLIVKLCFALAARKNTVVGRTEY
jgi:WSC domain